MATIKGQLEIDRKRGVIYFHVSVPKDAKKINGATLLRIAGVPKPIPKNQMLDIYLTGLRYNWSTLPKKRRVM